MLQKHPQALRYGENGLPMGQLQKQIVAQVLAQKQGTLPAALDCVFFVIQIRKGGKSFPEEMLDEMFGKSILPEDMLFFYLIHNF